MLNNKNRQLQIPNFSWNSRKLPSKPQDRLWRLNEEVAELLKALSHNDFRECFKGWKSLQNIVQLLMETAVNTIKCNNNFFDKILFMNQSYYQSCSTYNPQYRNPLLITQSCRQVAASCYKPSTVRCMCDILFFFTFHNRVIRQLCNSTATRYHSSGWFKLMTSKMTLAQSWIDWTIWLSHSCVNTQHILVFWHGTPCPLVHRYWRFIVL